MRDIVSRNSCESLLVWFGLVTSGYSARSFSIGVSMAMIFTLRTEFGAVCPGMETRDPIHQAIVPEVYDEAIVRHQDLFSNG
jgi:hypothetical protein